MASHSLDAPGRRNVHDWMTFVRGDAHILSRRPQLIFQQAANQPDPTAPAGAAARRFEAGLEARPWLRWVNKPAGPSACLATYQGHEGFVMACDLSPNGKLLVSGTDENRLVIWDALTGSRRSTLLVDDPVRTCAFSPDGTRIAVTLGDGDLMLLEAMTGATLWVRPGREPHAASCAFVRHGGGLVSATSDRTLEMLDVDTGAVLATFSGHRSGIRCCAAAAKENVIVSASQDGEVKIWEAGSQAALFSFTIEGAPIAFSGDGRQAASMTDEGVLRLWEVATGRPLKDLPCQDCHLTSAAFSPDNGMIVTGGRDGRIRLWDACGGGQLTSVGGHRDQVDALAFTPDGAHIVSGSWDGTVKLWKTLNLVDPLAPGKHQERVNVCRFSPDGQRIVSGASDGEVKLWDGSSGRNIADLARHSGGVTDCEFSADGTQIRSQAAGEKDRRWDVARSCELVQAPGAAPSPWESYPRIKRGDPEDREEGFWYLSLPGGAGIAAAYDLILKVFETTSITFLDWLRTNGRCEYVQEEWITDLDVSPDGRRLVVGFADGSLHLLRLEGLEATRWPSRCGT